MNSCSTTAPRSELSVLVVDDDPGVAKAIKLLLKFDGHKVQTVAGGKEALSQLELRNFDLIITDYSMPGMNGDRLAALIKKRRPNQPIIMVTGSSDTFNAYSRPPADVDQVVNKPFSRIQLREAMSRLKARMED